MAYYSPQLIHTMRTALDAVVTQVPVSHATPGFKAHLAEVILQAAAQGVTSYDGLVAAASDQIQTIISMLTWLKSNPELLTWSRVSVRFGSFTTGPSQ